MKKKSPEIPPLKSHGKITMFLGECWELLGPPTAQTSWEIQPKAVEVTTLRRQDLTDGSMDVEPTWFLHKSFDLRMFLRMTCG